MTMYDLPLELIIQAPGRTFTFSDSLLRRVGLNGARIRWGRSRVNEPPKSSSLSINVLLADGDAFTARDLWVFSRVELTQGGTTIFSGMIDGVAIEKSPAKSRNPWMANVTAVSALDVWSGPKNTSSKTITGSVGGWSKALEYLIEQEWPEHESPLQESLSGESLMRESGLRSTSQDFSGTWRSLWEAYIQLAPMAYASWNADLTKLWPTLSGVDQVMSTVVLDPRHVRDVDRSVAVELVDRPNNLVFDENQPFVFTTPGGGSWTYSVPIFQRHEIFHDGHDILIKGGENTDDQGSWFSWSAELLRAQVTGPRTLSVIDTDLQYLDTPTMERIFCPWETDIELIIQGDHMAPLTGKPNPAVHAIGGDLVINHDHIRHDMTCVWTGN